MLAVAEGRRIHRARIADPLTEERAARLMARLAPPAVDHRRVPGATVGALTGPEVAGQLAGLSYIQQCLLCARYLDDARARYIVEEWVLVVILRMSRNWRVAFSRKQILAAIVCDDLMPRRCEECKGRGVLPDERGLSESCGACDGIGRNLPTTDDKARRFGVSRKTWWNVWEGRAVNVLRYVQDVEADAVAVAGA